MLVNPFTEQKYRVLHEHGVSVGQVKRELKMLTDQQITKMRFVYQGRILYNNEPMPKGLVYYIPLTRPENFGEIYDPRF